MKTKLVLFDFSGTLVYFKFPNQKKYLETLENAGVELRSSEELKEFAFFFSYFLSKAASWQDLSEKLIARFNKNPEKETTKALADFLEKNVSFKLYDDVKNILSLPCKKAILTNAGRFLLRDFSLEGFEIFTPQDTNFLKPDEKAFLFVLEKMGVSPKETLLVSNDLEKDIAPASRLGIRTLLLDRDNKIETLFKKINSLKKVKAHLGL